MEQIFYYPARVIRAVSPGLVGLFPSDAVLLAQYRERFPDSPAERPYFLRTEISNNSLDHYFTHMLTSSLQNYAADAGEGVSLQDSHNTYRLGYGRSLFGLYDSQPGTPPGWDRSPRWGNPEYVFAIPQPTIYERVLSAAYIVPGVRLNNLSFASTDDFIQAVETGMVEEVSIGFGGGSMACDVCGASYYSWDCMHIAGFTYDVERNGQASVIMATVGVSNANLFEYSAVYAGATPNAVVIRKAEQEAEAGRLSRKQAAAIEERYRVRLAMPARNWPGFNSNERTKTMADEKPTNETTSQEQLNQFGEIRTLLDEANAEGETAPDRVRWLIGENTRLAPLADEGQQYRAALIDAAICEGVRAMGDKFPEETYRNMFKTAPIDQIKRLLESWGGQAAAVFTGGRQTVNEETPAQPQRQPAPVVPDTAYKS